MSAEDVSPLDAFVGLTGDDECLDWLWRRRYSADGRGARCPQCESWRRFHRIRSRRSYACDHCGRQIFPTAGTPFGGSSTPLSTWLEIAHLVLGAADDISAREIQRRFRLEYRTALRIKTRLREALADPQQAPLLTDAVAELFSPVEVRPRPTHVDPRTRARINKIRVAAARVFAQRGFAYTRIADVAAECGTTSAVVRNHFGTKDELLHAALLWTQERGASHLRALLRSEHDPRLRLEGLLEIALPTTDEIRDEYLLWLDAWARSRGGRRFDEDEIFSAWHEAVVEVVRQGEVAGVFELTCSAEDFGDAFVAFVDGLSFKVVEHYEEMPLHRAQELLGHWVDVQLGLGPRAAQARRRAGTSSPDP